MDTTGVLAVNVATKFFENLEISKEEDDEIKKIMKTILSNVKYHASKGKLSHKMQFPFSRFNKREELANYVSFKLRDEFLHTDVTNKDSGIEFNIMVP